MNNASVVAVVYCFYELTEPASAADFVDVLVLTYDVQQTSVLSVLHYNIHSVYTKMGQSLSMLLKCYVKDN